MSSSVRELNFDKPKSEFECHITFNGKQYRFNIDDGRHTPEAKTRSMEYYNERRCEWRQVINWNILYDVYSEYIRIKNSGE